MGRELCRREDRLRDWALLLVLLAFGGSGCAEKTAPRSERPLPGRAVPRPLEPGFLSRGVRALETELGPDARLLELRAEPGSLEVQRVVDAGVELLRYREPRGQAPSLAPVEGTVDPPAHVPVYGTGDLEANAFPLRELELQRIAQAFPVAVKAVDPLDGWVSGLVVRRNLPFGPAVRARIYVESPRMPGSIDTNGSGVPLKR
jgi:hypothetical protein